jgi:catechol 2,3-dioxygenase-like lactoylglutathione lyase family enzyme
MHATIERMVSDYEKGGLTRRQLVAGLAAIAAGGSASALASEAKSSTFTATGLNHIALSVSDVERARDFYVEHLGLQVTSESLPSNSFLDCGNEFLALFRGRQAGLAHYCYSIPDYNQREAAERLREAGLTPDLRGNRIYFPDPDGLVVQLASER